MSKEDLEMEKIKKKDLIFEKILNKYEEYFESNLYISKTSLRKFLYDSKTPLESSEKIEEGAFFVIKRPLCYLELIDNKDENNKNENNINNLNQAEASGNNIENINSNGDIIINENNINIRKNDNNENNNNINNNNDNNNINNSNDNNNNDNKNNNENRINNKNNQKKKIDIKFLVKAKFKDEENKQISFWVCSFGYLKEQLMNLGYKEAKIIKKKKILFSEDGEQENKNKESGGSSSESLDDKNNNLDFELIENKVRISKNPFNIGNIFDSAQNVFNPLAIWII